VGVSPSTSSRVQRACGSGLVGQCDSQAGRIALFEILPPSAALTMGTADPQSPETPPGYEPGPSVVLELAARLGIPRITLRPTQSFDEAERRANKGGNDAWILARSGSLSPNIRRRAGVIGFPPARDIQGLETGLPARHTLARELKTPLDRAPVVPVSVERTPERPTTFSYKEGRPWRKR